MTRAFIFALELFSAPVTQTQPPSLMPRSLASAGLISMNMSCCKLRQPRVGSGFLAAALVFDQPAGGEDERELLGNALLPRRLLHREADVRESELLGVRQRRIFRNEIDTRCVDRLTMHRDRVRQSERIHARFAVSVRNAAMLQRNALNAAGKIERPRNGVRRSRAYFVDYLHFGGGQIRVPAELFENRKGKLRVTVLDVGILRERTVGQQADLAGRAIRQLLFALKTESRAETATAVHRGKVRIIKQRCPGMLDFGEPQHGQGRP